MSGFPTMLSTSGITSCTTTPHIHPPNANHLPIVVTVDLTIPRTDKPPTRDFRGIDFDDFNKALKTNLALLSPPSHILTKADFDSAVLSLTSTIQQTIGDLIPLQKPCPFTKRWWSSDLTALKKKKNRLSNAAHKVRHITDHPTHALHKQAIKEFAKTIDKVATDYWTDWLENISLSQIYLANRYITKDPSDASCTRIPALRTPTASIPTLATSNSDKAKLLADLFFSPPPSTSSVPAHFDYPAPVPGLHFFSRQQIHETVHTLKPYKAPGPDGIPNIILMKCINVIIDHLFYIYRASLEFAFYHDYWLTSLTLVLCKPGKPAYDVAKAYRPIGLLDMIGKLLSTLVATDLSFLVETHGMLPSGQFRGRPGRNTTDAMHVVASKIKDAWRAGKVAMALFLDVQGAFPNTVKAQLIHNMRAHCYGTAPYLISLILSTMPLSSY